MRPESIISTRRLASTVRSHCQEELPGVEELILAALRLSISADEGRLPRLHINAGYRRNHSTLLHFEFPLEDLAYLALVITHPTIALTCRWDGEWQISGVAPSIFLPSDGFQLEITGPLSLTIRPSKHPLRKITVERGSIIQPDPGWEEEVESIGWNASPPGGRDGGSSAHALARAIHKVSVGNHGGAYVIIGEIDALQDIEIRYQAVLGPHFENLSGIPSHLTYAAVEECSDALAALSAIDGAVVMDRDLSLIGFGATLNIPPKKDAGGRGGHRHKSAGAFCKRHPGTVIFVISQDGPVTVYGVRDNLDA